MYLKVTRGVGSFPSLFWVLTAAAQARWFLGLVRAEVLLSPEGDPWPGHWQSWQCVTRLTLKRESPPIISGKRV